MRLYLPLYLPMTVRLVSKESQRYNNSGNAGKRTGKRVRESAHAIDPQQGRNIPGVPVGRLRAVAYFLSILFDGIEIGGTG